MIMKKQVLITITMLFLSFAFLSMINLKFSMQEIWEVPSKYEKMENPFANAADDQNIGRTLYAKHCKSCHGTKGKGDGTKAETIDTPIGDFTDASFQKQTDGSFYYKTVFGRDDMPSFENKISDDESRWLLVNYLRTLK